jgi:hypothetical protein
VASEGEAGREGLSRGTFNEAQAAEKIVAANCTGVQLFA